MSVNAPPTKPTPRRSWFGTVTFSTTSGSTGVNGFDVDPSGPETRPPSVVSWYVGRVTVLFDAPPSGATIEVVEVGGIRAPGMSTFSIGRPNSATSSSCFSAIPAMLVPAIGTNALFAAMSAEPTATGPLPVRSCFAKSRYRRSPSSMTGAVSVASRTPKYW